MSSCLTACIVCARGGVAAGSASGGETRSDANSRLNKDSANARGSGDEGEQREDQKGVANARGR
eukprot:9333921-Alexandrium_andersonii.AAC.1